jgi:hypothetical protein
MYPIQPIFACGSMHLAGGQIALMLFFIVGWWMSGALALVNAGLISFVRVSPKLKGVHFGLWGFYVIPGIILLLGLYDKIQLANTPSAIWITYAIAIPFVTVSHFVFLFRTRRKIRAKIIEVKNEDAA